MARPAPLPWLKMWDFVSACGQQADLHDLLSCAVREIPALISCDQSVACIADVVSPRGDAAVSLVNNGAPEKALRAYRDRYFYEDVARLRTSPSTEYFEFHWKNREFADSGFVRDFIRKLMKIDMSAGIPVLDPEGQGGISFIVTRTGAKGLRPREVAILLALRPHLVNFVNSFRRLERLTADHFLAAEMAAECDLLSKREAEIASLLCRRMRPEEIASMLVISPRTAETHIGHIYTKLNVRNRRELLGKLLGDAVERP
jgi:DNA-binding CsgD family transcriptional regulator